MIRIYTTGTRNRAATTLLVIGALGLVAGLMFIGLALLATLAVAGTVIGGGVALWHRLRGTTPALPRATAEPPLDPRLEVFQKPLGQLPDGRRTNDD